MPRASAWLVRLSLVHFGLAATLGCVLLARTAFPGAVAWPPPPAAHVETALVGFMLQFAMGVATWILPRASYVPRIPLGLAAPLLNSGVLLVAIGGVAPYVRISGRIAELLAVGILIAHIAPRIRPARSID